MNSRVGGTFGKYEIRRVLGRGGMGEVYEAFDTDKGRTVALKLLTDQYAQDENFRTRFLRESHAAAILQEPHVIPIHDWGEIGDVLYIDMRLVQGQTLHSMLKAGPLKPQRAVSIVAQIASALDAAHAQGLIHRDVKPQNIIVTPDDFAYLVDFGIAEAAGDTHLTMAGSQIGSLDYMAPERFGDEAATSAVDVYSLACVLYESLTGATPFPGHSMEQKIAAHMSSQPRQPSAVNSRVPAALDDVVARGMAKHPDDRYGSAGALARAAKRALEAEPAKPAAAANTMMAPPNVAPSYSYPPSYPPFPSQPGFPATGPTPVTGSDQLAVRPGPQWLMPAVIAMTVALVLGAVGVVIGLLVTRSSDSDGSSPAGYPGAADGTTTTTTTTTTMSAPADPEAQLRQYVNDDRKWVTANLDRWVPQVSSKRPGVVDDGIVWDNATTLQEHIQLRQQYGARLLWSGDWSTFSASNFWVTVAGVSFPTAEGALAWCRDNNRDSWHCFAKLISTTHPVEGSTAYN